MLLHFNSIKVRLKPPVVNDVTSPTSEFQFHKGTIKTIYPLDIDGFPIEFQFHKGTIKTHCFGIYNILIFNRICGCKVNKSY